MLAKVISSGRVGRHVNQRTRQRQIKTQIEGFEALNRRLTADLLLTPNWKWTEFMSKMGMLRALFIEIDPSLLMLCCSARSVRTLRFHLSSLLSSYVQLYTVIMSPCWGHLITTLPVFMESPHLWWFKVLSCIQINGWLRLLGVNPQFGSFRSRT